MRNEIINIAKTYAQTNEPSDAEVSLCINGAINELSELSPLLKTEIITKSDEWTALPSDWVENYSFIKGISDDHGRDLPFILQDGKIKVPDVNIGGIFYLTYSVPYFLTVVDSAESTNIPQIYQTPLGILLGAHLCELLASKYAQLQEQSLGAEIVNFRDKAEIFHRRAEELRAIAFRLLRVEVEKDGKREKPLGAFISVIPPSSEEQASYEDNR